MLYMVTPTTKGSGNFEYKDGESIKKIDFVQNRLVWFRGSELLHRGMSSDSETPRVTLSFKVNEEII